MSQQTSRERRFHRRLSTDLPIQIQTQTENIRGVLKDISRGGAAILINSEPLPVDSHLTLELGDKNSKFYCALPASIVMVRRIEGEPNTKQYILHIKFEELQIQNLQPLAIFMRGVMAEQSESNIDSHNFDGSSPQDVENFFSGLRLQPGLSLSSSQKTKANINRMAWVAVLGVGAAIVAFWFVRSHHQQQQSITTEQTISSPIADITASQKPVDQNLPSSVLPPIPASDILELTTKYVLTPKQIAKNVYFNQDLVGLLLFANSNLKSADMVIETGSTIHIPKFFTYTVQPGDTLAKIAAKYQEDASDYQFILADNANILQTPEDLQVGMQLKVAVILPWAQDWATAGGSSSP